MGVLKKSAKSLAKHTLPVSGNPIDQARSVLDRQRPCRKGAIRTFGLCSFDFRLQRLDQVCPVCHLGELRQFEAAIEELIRGRRRQRQHLDVPALELGEAAAGSDLRLEHAKVALGEHDPGFDILQRRMLGRDPANEVYLSAASVWEAVIKHALGKLPLPEPPAEYLPRQREAHQIATLAVEEAAFVHLSGLPSLHRDPFDRIILAQALQHQLVVVSVDEAFRSYTIPLLKWA